MGPPSYMRSVVDRNVIMRCILVYVCIYIYIYTYKHILIHTHIHIYICYVYGSVHTWSISIIVQRDATQSSLFIILQVHSTCFGCQPHPSSGVRKTTSLQRGQASLATLEGGSCTKNMTSTGGCSYSFVYSWWWVWLTLETCRVNLQNNK